MSRDPHHDSSTNKQGTQWRRDLRSGHSIAPRTHARTIGHLASSMPRYLVTLLCIGCVLLGAACSKKHVKKGVPFDLDKIFDGIEFQPTEEDWREKGVRLAQEKKYPEAIEAFQNYVVEEPEDYFGFNAMAVCHKNLGDFSNAMKNYDRALELTNIKEEKAKILANIGNLYFTTDKPQAALGFYKEAASEFRNNPLYLIFIARAFVVLEEYDRARKVLTEAERMEDRLTRYERPEDQGLGWYLMAYSYLALNEEDKVFTYLTKALKANPERFVQRIKKDLADEKSLLYTLRDNQELMEALKRYSLSTFLESFFPR